MTLSRAIEIYKDKCGQAINGGIDYKKIRPGCCCCVSGIDFGIVKFNSGDLYLKNGYRFKFIRELFSAIIE
jgi:hypothetical protein